MTLLRTSATQADIASASAALSRGDLVVIPTETVYGVAALATSEAALARLRALSPAGRAPSGPWAWHAPSGADAAAGLDLTHPVHRRLLRRLAPGPVTFVVEQADATLAASRERLGLRPGVIDDGSRAMVRVPDHPVALPVIRGVPGPVVAESIAALGWGPGWDPASIPSDAPVALVVNDGPTRYRKRSTQVLLTRDGACRVTIPGALDERHVLRHLERTVLFVCTGNTCRSPMAAAIARAELAAATPSGITTHVRSAGVAALPGQPATPEAAAALRRLGVEPGDHRSRELSRDLLAEAEVIYVMTSAHRRAVLALDPTAGPRVKPIDPAGDIPDPIGGGPEAYDQAATRLFAAVRARLEELDS